MIELIEKDLSYKIVGILFSVYNSLGSGYQEKYYQRAIAEELKIKGVKFKEQVYIPLYYKNKSIGKYFIDFIVEDKIVVEIKTNNKFYPRDIKQVLAYLKTSDIKLGILANFSRQKLYLKRILKGKNNS